jgi:hypothetical protein
MATDPIFTGTVNRNAGRVPATNDTSLTAPSNVTTVFTAGSSGSRVEQIRVIQIASSAAAGIVNIFVVNGGTYQLLDFVAYTVQTLSATSQTTPTDLYYTNLVLKSGDTIAVTNTANSAALFAVHVLGGDF